MRDRPPTLRGAVIAGRDPMPSVRHDGCEVTSDNRMIVLTGDVHHSGLGTRDQAHLEESEAEVAVRYAELAAQASVPITLFLTGRCVTEHPRELREMVATGAEIGGHTWDAFSPLLPRRILRKATRTSLHGPGWMQSIHIARTLDRLASATGRRPVSWRNHAYHNDRNTGSLLVRHGLRCWSDEVSEDLRPRREEDGLWRFPINVIPDHEHLFHAHRNPASVRKWVRRTGFDDVFGADSHDILEYERRFMVRLEEILSNDGVATLLLHPACMQLADGLAFFERVLQRIRGERCLTMADAANELERKVRVRATPAMKTKVQVA